MKNGNTICSSVSMWHTAQKCINLMNFSYSAYLENYHLYKGSPSVGKIYVDFNHLFKNMIHIF